jgi:PqqD family protein of HPr-rel-A system
MSAPAEPPIFHVPDPADFASLVVLDGFTLVYHRPSGQTHMLAEPAPEILIALGEGNAGAAEIVQRLARQHGILDSEGDAEAVIAARMAELAELGLIRAA